MRRVRHWRRLLIVLAVIGCGFGVYWWGVSYFAWQRALKAAGLEGEMAPPGRGERVLVVAPHPDDESLGCAGLIKQGIENGADVHVLVMTNGDANEWAVVFGERELPWNPRNMISMGETRQAESRRAMEALGLPPDHLYFLGYPNNGLVTLWRPEHWLHSDRYRSPYTHADRSPYATSMTPGAAYCGEQVFSDVLSVLTRVQPSRIYVTHPRDVHPDHWATNAFVSYALATAAMRGAEWAKTAQLWGYLVHWPRYPAPMRSRPGLDLLPPPELSGGGAPWYRLELTQEQVTLKMAAVRTYRSQEPWFDRLMLTFPRQDEIFEALPVTQSTGSLSWQDIKGHRRSMGGAEVKGLRLDIGGDLMARAELTTTAKRIPSRGYICLDLRTWNAKLSPVITTLYIRDREVTAFRLEGEAEPRRVLAKVQTKLGEVVVSRLPLPAGSLARQEMLVVCYGRVHDWQTATAVIERVRFGG